MLYYVCRFELDSREVKDEDSDSEDDIPHLEDVDDPDNIVDLSNNTDIDHTYNRLFQNIGFINNPIENLYRPTRRNLINQRTFVNEVMNVENQFLENRYIQNAIIASIYEQSGVMSDNEDDDMVLEDFTDDDI